MSDGYPYRPKILRGAFVEFGLSVPPLFVVFQFNPTQLVRNHGLTFSLPAEPAGAADAPPRTVRQRRGDFTNLLELQKTQLVTVQDHTIGFDIRLDATDRIDGNDAIAERFGIAPQLATLEQMMYPKDESELAGALNALLGEPSGFSFTRGANPPLVLFVFGRKRVLPVNINTMSITETEFSAELNPVQATVAVNLTVIEGRTVPYRYSKAAAEAMSLLNLANIADLKDVVIPG
jgi:hypothetical protein